MIEKRETCLYCGEPMESKTAKKKFCRPLHRVYWNRENKQTKQAAALALSNHKPTDETGQAQKAGSLGAVLGKSRHDLVFMEQKPHSPPDKIDRAGIVNKITELEAELPHLQDTQNGNARRKFVLNKIKELQRQLP